MEELYELEARYKWRPGTDHPLESLRKTMEEEDGIKHTGLQWEWLPERNVIIISPIKDSLIKEV